MSATSAIEWTEKTWNPTTGCDRISPGCDHCYALTLAKRLKGMGSAKYQNDGDPRTSGPGFGVAVHSGALTDPMKWRKPTTVFVNSMSDLFHARIPREFVARVFAVMAVTPQHTYQVLTKRPERMARMLSAERDLLCESFADIVALHSLPHPYTYDGRMADAVYAERQRQRRGAGKDPYARVAFDWPLPNVWLGTSIESDDYTRRADALRATTAAIRFVSAEPLLGPLPSLDLTGIDWLIAGGESGPQARAVDAVWIRDLRDRCAAEDTAFFFKQWGGRTPKANGRELDGRIHDGYPRQERAA